MTITLKFKGNICSKEIFFSSFEQNPKLHNIEPIYTSHFIAFFEPIHNMGKYLVRICALNYEVTKIKNFEISGPKLKIKRHTYQLLIIMEENRL